tara:strand:+ start:547 stop:1158 length:612 start_codon:yes stop_codon:yes gene_type:complete
MNNKKVRRKINEEGFTIIELVVVIAIVSLLASISVPSSIKWAKKEEQNSYIRELVGYIELVRREARRWNGSCTVKVAIVLAKTEGDPLVVACKGMNHTSKLNISRQIPVIKKTVFQELSSDFSVTPKGHISVPATAINQSSVVFVVGGRHNASTGSSFPKCIVLEAPSGVIRTGIYQNSYQMIETRTGSKYQTRLNGNICASN